MLTKDALLALGVSDKVADVWLPELLATMSKYQINTAQRQAMFIAQVAHESANFHFLVENLNYSANALERIFKKYFPNREFATAYERKPELIANRVYANRMGNRDESSGDGWKYRGRGLMQLTGADNYKAFALQNNNRAYAQPDLVAEPTLAADSAGWFWQANRLNSISDTSDVRAVTRRVNGGYNGIEDRERKYNTLIVLLDR